MMSTRRITTLVLAVVTLIAFAITCTAAEQPAAERPRFGRPRGPRVVSPEISADRRVTFRILAPKAEAVRLSGTDIPGLGFGQGAAMTKDPKKPFHQRIEHEHVESGVRSRIGLHGYQGCASWCCC